MLIKLNIIHIVLFINLLNDLINFCLSINLKKFKYDYFNIGEPVYVLSSSHQKSPNNDLPRLNDNRHFNQSHIHYRKQVENNEKGFKVLKQQQSGHLPKNNTFPVVDTLQTSLFQPVTILLLSYLASRVSNSSLIHDKLKLWKDKNLTENESRTLSSWLSGIASKIKKYREPSRKDYDPIIFSNFFQQFDQTSPPIKPSYLPPSSNNDQYLIPNFVSSEGRFPDPLNPNSILLPPEVIENSGIKDWLNFIEKMSLGEVSDEQMFDLPSLDYSFSSFKKNRKKLIPNSRPFKEKPIKIPLPTYGEEITGSFMQEDDEEEEEESSNNETTEIIKEPPNFPRCDKFTPHICVDDFEYPEQTILDEIYKRRDIFELMYSEVRINVPLVDGISRDVEESYNYDHYFNNEKNGDIKETSVYSNSRKSESNKKMTGFVCPSEVLYGKPKLARNFRGKWKLIVNAGEFTQTVRMEKCLKPNKPCNFIKNDGLNTRCAQIHSLHRLMVFEKGKGFYIDTFRIPTACSCYTSKKHSKVKTVSEYQNSTSSSSNQISNALWSILGEVSPDTGQILNSLNSDTFKNHYLFTQFNKNFPQLNNNQMSPSVIQQLSSNADILQNVPAFSYPSLVSRPDQQFYSNQISSKPSQNNFDYFLPGMMYAEEPIVFPQTTSNQGFHASTTLNTKTTSSGAPLVQVIHVPFSSLPILPQLQHHQSQLPPYLAHKKDKGQKEYSRFSYSNQKPDSKDEVVSEKHFNSKYFATGSQDDYLDRSIKVSNKSKFDRFFTEEESRMNKKKINGPMVKFDSEDNLGAMRKNFANSESNKKVNFSYHPILEYIHPDNEMKKQ